MADVRRIIKRYAYTAFTFTYAYLTVRPGRLLPHHALFKLSFLRRWMVEPHTAATPHTTQRNLTGVSIIIVVWCDVYPVPGII